MTEEQLLRIGAESIARDPTAWAARWLVMSIQVQKTNPQPLPPGSRRIA